ncbi:TlpA disulfide reductase family protein [Flavivirga spongiicola]|uniref:TlpA family protein disulfide reductase n=1 Tax=Flavivirga spongiicola TaxID=421621 RepID=A0ABU7XUB0_9FLAO|nr:TlpA disulfide reductase family protein [Flavivirga sp. MEBiC05379]MDO5979376.1 TlpA disulfide reductase family protein [Flavivirga sp. MEBiC05379]
MKKLATILMVFNLLTISSFSQIDSIAINKMRHPEALLNKKLPDFSGTSLSGISWDNSKIKGKVILINFWFIGCPPCMKEIEYLNQINKEYKDKDFVLLSIAPQIAEDLNSFNNKEYQENVPSQVRKVLKAPIIEYEIIPVCDTKKYSDYTKMGIECNYTYNNFNVLGFPTTFIIDKDGIIKYIKTGFAVNSNSDKQLIIGEYKKVINELLEK